MNAYVYRASLYCETCGARIIAGLPASRIAWPAVMRDDSECYPQGPIPDGGGEADTPQHCGACNTFLENPLTPDGYSYVAEQIDDYCSQDHYPKTVLRQWAEFYHGENDDLDRAIAEWQSVKPADWR